MIMPSGLLSHELDPRVKRGAELSMNEKRVVNSIPLADRKLARPGGPKRAVSFGDTQPGMVSTPSEGG